MSKRQSKSQGRAAQGSRGVAMPAFLDARLLKVAFWFFLIFTLLQTAWWLLLYRGYLTPALEVTANLTGIGARLVGVSAAVTGNQVTLATRILRIDPECVGVSLLALYSALVLAYPLSLRRRVIGLVLGIPALIAANMLRLIAVAVLSDHLSNSSFLFVHDYLFKVFMMAVVIILWSVYLASAQRRSI